MFAKSAARWRTWTTSSATVLAAIFTLVCSQCDAQYRTANFIVYCSQPAFAKQTGDMAEKYRKELAELWLGKELPNWPSPCPITVWFERLAGGETSFAFTTQPNGTSYPVDWRMKVFGSPERILDSVLPHEVTHTVFATHFGRPLPRWADEGACTTVEHVNERKKNHQMLIQFLHSNRGIPFNHMFAMKQYPRDILPLYAQGHSLAKYLIQQKGHRHYVNFVGEGMQREVRGREPVTWSQVIQKYYGYEDLSDLQIRWLAWVKEGSPNLSVQALVNADTPANQTRTTQPTPKIADSRALGTTNHDKADHDKAIASMVQPPRSLEAPSQLNPEESWYLQQSRVGRQSSSNHTVSDLTRGRSGYRPGSVNGGGTGTAISKRQTTSETHWR